VARKVGFFTVNIEAWSVREFDEKAFGVIKAGELGKSN
jgi:hypothetical protein